MTSAPMLSAFSLFSGAGGMDIGIRQAGFNLLACIEIDPYCCETLRDAVSREKLLSQVIERDIREIEPSHLIEDLNLKPGELDLLFGGSPCQSFSQAGKRGSLSDERGLLLFEFVRFAAVFKPKSIMIEQVKGILTAADQQGKAGGVYEQLINQLKELGYRAKMTIINAADYGVAQLRERVFIVATELENYFDFPAPTHAKPAQQLSLFPLQYYRTVGEMIDGLNQPSKNIKNLPKDSHVDITPPGDRQRIHGVPEDSYLAKELHLPEKQRCKLTKKDTTKFRRLSFSKPSLTLRCGEIFFHPIEDRYLTPREYMRIHGYPDNYLLKGPVRGRSGRVRYLDQHRQIANSVPPPVARIIAEELSKILTQSQLKSQSLAKEFIRI
jgi:DNA (cytosine-5)-methyltransferase 1